MSAPLTPSQTVGPFFGVGLPYDGGPEVVPAATPNALRIEGQVLDGHGEPVPDALIELAQAGNSVAEMAGQPVLFGRSRTDSEGAFSFVTVKPARTKAPDGTLEAPHLNVTVFARGLLRHLVTRMYFPDEGEANTSDPVLRLVPAERRSTLFARADGKLLHFDIRLQGDNETVFFAI
jgi:protocatechuate 3,4-dioxygenase alpha subunit